MRNPLRPELQCPIVYCPSGNQGWIIDFMAQDIANFYNAKLVRIPRRRRELTLHASRLIKYTSHKYIFVHHRMFISLLMQSQIDLNSVNIVYFCHHEISNSNQKNELIKNLRFATKIIVMSTESKNFLINKLGNEHASKIKVLIGGADCSQFTNLNKKRNPKSVIFVNNLAKRKRPDLILRTVQTNPDFTFILHGKGWKGSPILNKLKQLPNFKYYVFDFKIAAKLYNSSFTFLSLSDLEGGPIPILEALASGCRVITTDTGWAQDVAKISNSVLILPVDPSEEEVKKSLHKILLFEQPNTTVAKYFSYENFLKAFQ
jgi:glycosyltransferase involved in cell wall biosynthesis